MENKQSVYKRIVVKIGSSTLTHKAGKLNFSRIDHLLRQLVDIKNKGREVLLVTSGAIAAGMGEVGLEEKPREIKKQQAAAAVGQSLLMGIYNKILREYGEKGGQILLTAKDLEDRERYLNAYNTLITLLEYEVIPIINENDTVATKEIEFGDNDTLAARVAGLVEADLLINITDIAGLYNKKPDKNTKDLKIIHRVDNITSEIKKIAGKKGSKVGTGGMYTKIEAAKIATESGIPMIIGPGYKENIILDLIEMIEIGEFNRGTTFLPQEDSLSKRKQWLCFNVPAAGSIVIDKGAEKALLSRGKSLLPGGIIAVKDSFNRGDLVNILNQSEEKVGKGLANYSAEEIEKIKGHHTSEIYDILGYVNEEEVLHRDNMVMTEKV